MSAPKKAVRARVMGNHPYMFVRADTFYVVEIPPEQVEVNVKLNPGTVKVLDAITQEGVWPLIPKARQ